MKNDFVVYTAIFGDYDDLIEPEENYEGCDFICFTDQKNLVSDIWDIKIIDKPDLSPHMMNRKFKILPHKFLNQYSQSLYLDANISLRGNPLDLVNKYLVKYDMIQPKHFERNCIYKEAEECIILARSSFSHTCKQMKKYRNEGFPINFGLGENGVLLRSHMKKNIIHLMEEWWKELNNETSRDQLSLAYILWKNNREFKFMDEGLRNNPEYFKFIMHKRYIPTNILEKIKIKSTLFIRKIIFSIFKINFK